MRVWFYKGKGDWYSGIIRFVTRSPYSHCLIEFSDGTGISSSATSGGVETFTSDDLMIELSHREDWDCVEITKSNATTIVNELHIHDWCKEELGCKYDFFGVLFGWLNDRYQHPEKWFCSEICRDVVRFVYPIKDTWLSPGDLYDEIIALRSKYGDPDTLGDT